MTEKLPRTIPIFEVAAVQEQVSTDARCRPRVSRGGPRSKITHVVKTSVDVLSRNLQQFVGSISSVLSSGAKSAGDFDIDSVEVECFISGSGQIGLVGTGVEIQGGSTLKIIFTRRKEKDND